jgi:hypothetical protein
MIKNIDHLSLDSFTALNSLDLSCNSLEMKTHDSNQPIFVRVLYIQYSNITFIEPHYFSMYKKTKSIELGHNNLQRIRACTFCGTLNLFSLHFYNNKIDFIEEHAFKDLHYLSLLDLNHNQLEAIHSHYFKKI